MSVTVTFHSDRVSRGAIERAIGQLEERLVAADPEARVVVHGAKEIVMHIDVTAPAVYIGGERVDLTWRQARLVACLYEAGVDQPVPFHVVAEAAKVRGTTGAVYTNVRTLASRARTNLPPNTILSVKGVGYRLSPAHTYLPTGPTA